MGIQLDLPHIMKYNNLSSAHECKATATIVSSSSDRQKPQSSWSSTLAALHRPCSVPSFHEFVHARFMMMLVRGFPHTRSKFRSNHCLHCDTMPLTTKNLFLRILDNHYCLYMVLPQLDLHRTYIHHLIT